MLETVIGLCDGGAGEGVGLNNVRSGFEEGAVDVTDDVRTGDAEQIVVALQIAFHPGKGFVAKVGFFQLVLLNHRAHRTIQIDNALREQLGEELTFGGQRFLECLSLHRIQISTHPDILICKCKVRMARVYDW